MEAFSQIEALTWKGTSIVAFCVDDTRITVFTRRWKPLDGRRPAMEEDLRWRKTCYHLRSIALMAAVLGLRDGAKTGAK